MFLRYDPAEQCLWLCGHSIRFSSSVLVFWASLFLVKYFFCFGVLWRLFRRSGDLERRVVSLDKKWNLLQNLSPFSFLCSKPFCRGVFLRDLVLGVVFFLFFFFFGTELTEMNLNELKWNEMKWTELKWTEMNRTELKREGGGLAFFFFSSELNRNELKWTELNWTETGGSLAFFFFWRF